MRTDLSGNRLAVRENRERLVRGLGWFSIGLGAVELLFPRAVSALIGVRPRPRLIQLLGLRELAAGLGILRQPDTRPFIKARVIGDAMDLGLLGTAAFSRHTKMGRWAFAVGSVAGVTALDYLCHQDLQSRPEPQTREFGVHPEVIHLRRSLIVNRPPEELYQVWRDFRNLPRFMHNVVSIQEREDHKWHWITQGPAGLRVEWDAEISQDRPKELIAWRSLPNGDVEHAGSVRFERAPGGRGTVVRVEMQYRPPAGRAGNLVARLLGKSPELQVRADLLRFKQLVETGEIARTEGQPAGRSRSTSRKYDDLIRAT